MALAQQVIQISSIILANCSTRVRVLTIVLPFRAHPPPEGAFDAAEPHFLASGKRDSARLLAEMFIQWAAESGSYGAFALRGTIPYVKIPLLWVSARLIQH